MTRNRRITLIVFLVVLGLSMFHPVGRLFMKFFIPIGIHATELIGFVCFIAVIVIILIPRKELAVYIRRCIPRKKISNTEKTIIEHLEALGANSELHLQFKRLHALGKINDLNIAVDAFMNHYGPQVIKLLQFKSILICDQDSSVAVSDINEALDKIYIRCAEFIRSLVTAGAGVIHHEFSELEPKVNNKKGEI